MVSRELEWFDLETRMREVLHLQLIPVVAKAKEDRDQLNMTRSHCSKLESRIKQLETMVFGDKDQETVMQEIFAKFAEAEGNRKRQNIQTEQEVSFINEKIKAINFTLNELGDWLQSVMKRAQKNEEEFCNLELVVEHNKESMIKELENIGRNFRDLNATYTNISLRAEEKAMAASDKAKAISLEIGMFKRELESIWKSHNEIVYMARDSKANKLDIDEFNEYKETLGSKFKEVSDNYTKIKDEFFHRDLFLDKFYPMKVVTIVSDYFYHSLDMEQLSKLVEYESFILMQLNTEILNNITHSRDAQVQKILDDIRKVEERKSKLSRSSLKRPQKTLKSSIKINIDLSEMEESKGPPSKPTDALNVLSAHEAFEEGVVEKLILKLNSEVTKIRSELNNQIQQMTHHLQSSAENNNSMMKQVLFELSETSEDRSREKLNLEKEIQSLAGKLQELKGQVEAHEDLLAKQSKTSNFLVEAFQIQQLLDAQDEEDRHGLAQNIDKDLQNELIMSLENSEHYNSVLPSANFLLKKNCLACGQTTSMLAGVRTSVVYHPSPVAYRDRVFLRPDLIGIKGKLIDGLRKNTGLVKEEGLEGFVREVSKGMKSLTLASTSRVESVDRELPSLNLGTSRNRSRKRNRFLIKSVVHSVDKYQF